MIPMKKAFLFLCLTASLAIRAQQAHISGFVNDAHSGERVIGVNVYLHDRSHGTSTDAKGYFNLSADLPAYLCLSCIGYADTCFKVERVGDHPISIRLRPLSETLQTVEVSAKRMERQPFNALTLSAKNIDQLPTLGTRPDIIKAAQQLPGVEPLTEGSSLMLVRGGNPGENLYLLDNVPLIYVNHIGGFMSVFNSEMINSMDIYKGGFPARFGGKLSSIVDLTAKKGDPSRVKGSLSAGITDVAFALEGPGGLNSSSFIITGRKTLTELLLYAASEIAIESDAQEHHVIYGFHDINAKYTWSPDAKNSFAFNLYEGDDYMRIWKNKKENGDIERNSVGNIWGNRLVSAQWNSAVSAKLFAANTLSFTQYRLKNQSKAYMRSDMDTVDFFVKASSRVSDLSMRSDWKLFLNAFWTLEYGLHASYLNYRPNHFVSSYAKPSIPDMSGVSDNALYFDNKLNLGTCASGTIGLRLNSYFNGSYRNFAWEPRLNFNFRIGESQLNLTAMRVTQNAHLMMAPGAIMNNEVWVPAEQRIRPACSDQASIGWQRDFMAGHIGIEVDAYYKLLRNLATYREGISSLIGDPDWRNKVEAGGKGKSYGLEMMAKLNFGRLNGYVGYTYAHTTRQFEHINQGKEYVFEYDRPHSINLNANYMLTERWSLSALWTFQSGLPFTPVIGVQHVPSISQEGEVTMTEAFIYGERNSRRMRSYHRLDVAAKWKTTTEKGRKAEWTFSVYNVYCRQNPYYYYYGDKKGDPLDWGQYPDDPPQLWQRCFFPVIPSVSYKVWF